MASLKDVSVAIMDLFYQDYKKEDDFFSEEHFFYMAGVAFSKILEMEYKASRKEAKAEEGITDVQLQPDWQVAAEIMVQKIDGTSDYKATLPHRPFSFPYDEYGYGIQRVRNVSHQGCRDFIRTTQKLDWALDDLPRTDKTFFYLEGINIILKKPNCLLKKIKVLYIPEVTDESFGPEGGEIPSSKRDDIIRATLSLMKQAKEGTIVDTTNNSNPNRTIQTEIDSHLQTIRNKPQ
jgi:hypothetical protein